MKFRFRLRCLWLSVFLGLIFSSLSFAQSNTPEPASNEKNKEVVHRCPKNMICPEIAEHRLYRDAQQIAEQMANQGLLQKFWGSVTRQIKNNTAGDWTWVGARALINAVALTIYLTQKEHPVSVEQAAWIATTGAFLGAGFQVFTEGYVNWVTHQTENNSLSGFFKFKRDADKKMVPASAKETWTKELFLQVFYMAVIHLVSVAVKVDPLSHQFLITSVLSWLTEGSWSLIIAQSVENIQTKLKESKRLGWHLGKAAFAGLSLISCILMITNLHSDQISYYAYYILGGIGIPTYFYYFADPKLIRNRVDNAFQKTKKTCLMIADRIGKIGRS